MPVTHHVERFIEVELAVKQVVDMPTARGIPALLDAWGFSRQTQESAWVIAYDAEKQIRTIAEVARGSYHQTRVHIAPLLSVVALAAADRFYLVHNHPSGNVTPTAHDLELTFTVLQAANACGFYFEDHIIIGPPSKSYSLKAHKLYTPPDITMVLAKEASR